jgi:flagellar FliL protein
MATKKPAPAPAKPAAAPAKAAAADDKAAPAKKKRRAMPVLAFLMLACAAGAGGWHYLRLQSANAATAPKAEKKPEPVYLPLEQFTVNLTTTTIDRFLQIGITLEMSGSEAGERVKKHLPVVRSRILLLLASKTAEDLATPAGKQKLVDEILRESRAVLPEAGTPSKGIENAHFSAFVVQ